jgi:hypothetical protein
VNAGARRGARASPGRLGARRIAITGDGVGAGPRRYPERAPARRLWGESHDHPGRTRKTLRAA